MTFRVAMLEFIHESNTFNCQPTDLSAFASGRYYCGDDIIAHMRETGSEIAGCIDVAEDHEWELVPIVAAEAQPAGPVTEHARRAITDTVQEMISATGPFDGIFVALHGAMVTETAQDGESQFLGELRKVVGNDLPIAATLDLHANIFDEMVGLIQIAVSYRTYPHVDMRERGREACALLQRTMTGEIRPRVVVDRPPMLVGCDDGRTTSDGPMTHLLNEASRLQKTTGILCISINAGFTDADVHAAGPSVLVTYDTRTASAETASTMAAQLCNRIWCDRHAWTTPMGLECCMKAMRSSLPSSKPIVIADFSDNPGSGAYGDCTAILAALLDAGLENAALGALYDPAAAALLTKAGVGTEVTLSLGGKTDARIGECPIEISGVVMAVSDGDFVYEGPMHTGLLGRLGTSVCLRTRGIDIAIVSKNIQLLDQNMFRAVGIEPVTKSILVVKSMQHFRAAFAPIAEKIYVVDAGGLCSPNVTAREYRNLRRPVFPLDDADA